MSATAAVRSGLRRGRRSIRSVAVRLRESVEARSEHHADPRSFTIEGIGPEHATNVEEYWTAHTVNSIPFRSARSSLRNLEERSREYPRFEELMDLRADHSRHVVLDYGCGPGNDLVNFSVRCHAARTIGVDISMTALNLARARLALHDVDPARISLVKVADDVPEIPLPDASVDYLYCEGVIHHTSHPQELLAQLRRVLKPSGRGHLMVYNRNSIWYHLYTAYQRQIVEGSFAGLSVDEAFRRNTDGETCPIARAYRPEEFEEMCKLAGFRAAFVGGYPARIELDLYRDLLPAAVADVRLAEEHRRFLAALVPDERGDPTSGGYLAGVGGVYQVSPSAS